MQNWKINKLKAKVEAERRKLEKAEADEAKGAATGEAEEASRGVRRKLLDEADDRESRHSKQRLPSFESSFIAASLVDPGAVNRARVCVCFTSSPVIPVCVFVFARVPASSVLPIA